MTTATVTNAPAKLGTFGGVFTPTILTILGVIMFMRVNFVIGEAGILSAVLILLLAKSITFLTSLSISAISTNMKVKGGGSYFLISRVLGMEFGGAVGLSLFLATAFSVPFYIIGFTEALTLTFPSTEAWTLPISLASAALLYVVAYVGANWAIKVQFVIMGILFLAIVAFTGGAIQHFSLEQFTQNLDPGYTELMGGLGSYSFWMIFAIYFPAVTGIDAGLNMSGDLKDATKSLPKGTLLGVAVGFLVYISQILLSGGAYSRAALITDPFTLLVDNALFGFGFLVVAGVFAATLSSALGSYLGAPRVLQALAKDSVIGLLNPFAKGAGASDEPRRALAFTGVITVAVLLFTHFSPNGDSLNMIASVVTMFFLYTYSIINFAAFTEAFGQNPSFRPTFKLFHWLTALLGGVGCLAAAILVDATAAIVSGILILGLIFYLRRQQHASLFGDARRGFVYSHARKNLLLLSRMKEDAKNWRPTSIVFTGNPYRREPLVKYAVWLSANRGIVWLGTVIVGEIKRLFDQRATMERKITAFCDENEIEAFPLVVVQQSFEEGMSVLLQSAGLGMLRPNLAIFGWSDEPEKVQAYCQQIRLACELGLNIVLIKTNGEPPPKKQKGIQVWWRGSQNGELMLILAHLLSQNWEWAQSRLTILRAIEDEVGVVPVTQHLEFLVEEARVTAQTRAVVTKDPFDVTLAELSKEADCVFMGFKPPAPGEEVAWYAAYNQLLTQDRETTYVLVHHAVQAEQLLV